VNQIEEQQELRAELIAHYGQKTFERALEMSGISCCLQALATDALSEVERKAAYMMAGLHLAKLQASFLSGEDSAALTECAKRIDAAMEAWTLDELEERDGLPPSPRL